MTSKRDEFKAKLGPSNFGRTKSTNIEAKPTQWMNTYVYNKLIDNEKLIYISEDKNIYMIPRGSALNKIHTGDYDNIASELGAPIGRVIGGIKNSRAKKGAAGDVQSGVILKECTILIEGQLKQDFFMKGLKLQNQTTSHLVSGKNSDLVNEVSMMNSKYKSDNLNIYTYGAFLESNKRVFFTMAPKGHYNWKLYTKDDLLNFINDITNALRTLRKNNMYHNDVKSGNIIKLDGRYKLIDFGKTSSIHQDGTLKYSKRILDDKSDFFSLIITIHDLINSQHKFTDITQCITNHVDIKQKTLKHPAFDEEKILTKIKRILNGSNSAHLPRTNRRRLSLNSATAKKHSGSRRAGSISIR